MTVQSYPSALSISPHSTSRNIGEAELRADLTLPDVAGGPKRYRSIHVTVAGGGSLVLLADNGDEVALHGLEAGKDASPTPQIYAGHKASSTGFDAVAAYVIDNDAYDSDETTDFNAAAGTYLLMPAAEVITVDGLLLGFTRPFGGFTFTADTLGVGGTMAGSVYTGDTDAAFSFSDFTAVTLSGAGKDALASGDVRWDVPLSTWRPSVGPSGSPSATAGTELYWFFWSPASTYSTNPVGSQGQLKNFTNVRGLRVGL